MNKLLNFFRKQPVQLEVVRCDESKLRLADWQHDRALCAIATNVLADPNVRLMLSVLKNEHPAHSALPYGVSMDDRVTLQCRAEGYEICLANLEAMTKCKVFEALPEATFENETAKG